MTIRSARRRKVLAHLVPSLVSAVLVLMVAAALPAPAGAVVLLGVPLLGLAGLTSTGEPVAARLLWRAGPATAYQQTCLAPVVQILTDRGVLTPSLRLLVMPLYDPQVRGLGRSTVIVTDSLVRAVARRQLSPAEAAAVMAHEVGVLRAGLTRAEPCLLVLLAPWRVWLAPMCFLWGLTIGLLPRAIRAPVLVGIWLACLWLAYRDRDLAYLAAATPMLAAALTWRAITQWSRARACVGDCYVQQVSLGPVLAGLLLRANNAETVWHRAQALHQPPTVDAHAGRTGRPASAGSAAALGPDAARRRPAPARRVWTAR